MRPNPTRLLGVLAVVLAIAVSSASASTQGRLGAAKSQENALRGTIGSDTARIQGFQGRIDDLQVRLNALQGSLDAERSQLLSIRSQLRTARGRLLGLKAALMRDRRVLAAQLLTEYESPPPDIVNVVIDAHGFTDLLERVDDLKRVQGQKVDAITQVRAEQEALTTQARRLAELQTRQERVTTSELIQRNEVAQLRLAVVAHQRHYTQARASKLAVLSGLKARSRVLEHRLEQETASAGGLPDGATFTGGGFSAHGGSSGFFQAPGTNYSVGDTPKLAARLDALGKALHLHLIGISGYRTPQHSVEVGGFANDPHTKGQASDTPGVEGVPEATLNRFGLTRPFGGAAEADHIQLLGSI